jgi:MscS family membrane protein
MGNIFNMVTDDWIFISLEVMLIIAGTFSVSFILVRILQKLKKISHQTKTVKDEVIYNSLSGPLQFLIYAFGVLLVFEVLNTKFKFEVIAALSSAKAIVTITVLLWVTLNIISGFEKYLLHSLKEKKTKLNKTSISAIIKLLKAISSIIAAIVILEFLGFNMSGIIAFGSAGAFAVGLSARDLLANIFGAIMIYLDRPFKIGDWIIIPEKGIEGKVETIGARCTVIETFDKRPLYVPNSIFSLVSIENPSRMSHRKLYEFISLRYEDLPLVDDLIADIRKLFAGNPYVAKNLSTIININNFNSSAINILIYAFITDTSETGFHNIKHKLMMGAAEIVEKHGAKMSEVYIKK